MILLIAATILALLLTIFFMGRTRINFRRRRLLRCGAAGLSCVAAAATGFLGLVMTYTYWSYDSLIPGQLVSTIEFRRLASHQYQARLVAPGRDDRFFNLDGDEWQIDARIINWHRPLTELRIAPVYKLERLSARYSEVDIEQTELRSVHLMSAPILLDMWTISRRFQLPGVDADYAAATYLPMADGARFDLSLDREALQARPGNEAAEIAARDRSN